MAQAVILSGGMIDAEFCSSYLTQIPQAVTIAADSGMRYFYSTGQNPDWIIGDFDSVDPRILHYFEQQEDISWIRLIPEKDDTDTEAAIRKAVELGCDTIHLLGATGSRLDHVLGNIQLLGIGFESGCSVILADPHNRIRLIREPVRIRKCEQYGKYVSLIPFTPQVTDLTLKGMKYPLDHYNMQCFNSLGVSNEITDEEAEIAFSDGILLLLETADGPWKPEREWNSPE